MSVGNSDLKLVGLNDLGSAGTGKETPLIIRWNILWSIGWVLIYPLLIPFFLLKPNRNKHAVKLALLFMPLLVFQIIAACFFPVLTVPLAHLLVLWAGFAILWLVGFLYAGGHRGWIFLRSMFVLGGMTALAAFTINEFTPSPIVPLMLINLILCVMIVATAYGCRRRFTPLRFLLSYIVGASLLAPPLVIGVLLYFPNFAFSEILVRAVVTVVMLWFFGIVVLLPFLLFAFYNPCFRQRFDGIFRLQK